MEQLGPFAHATLPRAQLQSEQRRRITRLARPTKRRPALLAFLESRYLKRTPVSSWPVDQKLLGNKVKQ